MKMNLRLARFLQTVPAPPTRFIPLPRLCLKIPGVKKAVLNTIHAYTATQKTVDGPDAKDWRRGRAAAVNIVPSTTGAAISVTEAVKGLKGRFDGIAIRVPLGNRLFGRFYFCLIQAHKR